ncbi:sulfur carrier protein ThiS [Neisseriaceae bacterium TC5R-5]|nr:sulfur carrier protein ThiS [Neisseriaceae bacterium TC5R-5]
MKMLSLLINGEDRQLAVANLLQLIQLLDLGDKRVAVERNGEIVPKSQYEMVCLESGDELEIVVAVGGG